MKLIIGLGNPGKKYEKTRHNIGFMAVDAVAKMLGRTWDKSKAVRSWIAKTPDVILAKPDTYMNSSGVAVLLLTRYYNIDVSDLWVVTDDIDLPMGQMRIRERGGSGGHNGMQSIIDQLGRDDFVRFRLGIGRQEGHGTDSDGVYERVISHVLSDFTPDQTPLKRALVARAAEAIRHALDHDIVETMNRYNQ